MIIKPHGTSSIFKVCDHCRKKTNNLNFSPFLGKDLCPSCIRDLEIKDRQKNPWKYLAFCGVPKAYQKKTLDKFQGNDQLIREIKQHIEKRPFQNLLFSGVPGCGKTHIAIAIMSELVKRLYPIDKMYFISFEWLLQQIRASYDSPHPNTEEALLERLCQYELLVIDDIGVSHTTDFQARILYMLLDRRLSEGKKFIITTNLRFSDNSDEVLDRYGARIASRLAEFRTIIIEMPDYRKRKHNK